MVLIVIGGILGPVALAANWARTIAADDDEYVQAVAPLATDPVITDALRDQLVAAAMAAVDDADVSGQIEESLSGLDLPGVVVDAAVTALGALNGNIRDLVTQAVEEIVAAPGFAAAWEKINRAAHHQFVLLMKEDSALLDSSGNVALQLEPLLDRVRAALTERGQAWAARIPESTAEYVVIEAEDVTELKSYYSRLISWSVAVMVAALCALIGAVVLAPDRRHAAGGAFTALAAGTIVLALLLRFGVEAVSGRARSPDASKEILTTVIADLVGWIRLVALISLAVAVLLWVWAPGRQGQRIWSLLVRMRSTLSSPPLLAARRAVCGLLAVVAVLVLLFVDSLSIFSTVLLVLVVVITTVLAVTPAHETTT